MKSVGIITVHDIYNYGSILQAYATQKAIADLGYKAEIIDYKYPNPFHQQQQSLKSKALAKANAFLKDLLPGKKYSTYVNNYKTFTTKHYQLSKSSYPTVDSLMDNPPEYDIYLAGSDQIWRPEFVKGDPCFFLDFVKGKKKIAYASSFGCTSVPEKYKKSYAKFLKNFSAIGVREYAGTEIIKELTSIDAKVVLDPTLLLNKNDWMNVMKAPKVDSPYILCYGISSKDRYLEKLALHIQQKTGYKIIRINGKFYDYFNSNMKYILDAGPAEWLGFFANAAVILGQSFHATAFAVNFEKPFLSILRGKENHDSRQKQLLEILKLQHRSIVAGERFPDINNSFLKIDYSHVNEILKKERKSSLKFLATALNQ
ncbi:polysaccharide pyruvyl transferase family protein [Maribellus mangrovi]|uniref:polysaccharide pyruvyl transferase family protein n=1 Tax=Maribellus mangrovi TaxID=3133146 RepID=UPI0030EDD70C